MSPRPWSKMISAGNAAVGASETTAVGAALSQAGAIFDALAGCWGVPATKRWLPSLSAFHAFTGLVFGMGPIVHCRPGGHTVSLDPDEVALLVPECQRDLPWRAPEVSPWQILVSEFMLQQTPAARVAPIWSTWISRWPTPSSTARGRTGRDPSRMGQTRLSRRQTVARMRNRHRHRAPRHRSRRRRNPAQPAGVGAYTARAIACFAYGKRVPVVDTNVRRVVARAVHGRADSGAPSTVRDHADAALLPDNSSAPMFPRA